MIMTKRYSAPKAKKGELLVKYGKVDGVCDIQYCWPDNESSMHIDINLLLIALHRNKMFEGKSLIEELENRGYDITTLKFAIKKVET